MQNVVLTSLLFICLITDLRERRIYNLVLLPALIFGLIYNIFIGGWAGLGQSLLGLLVGLGVLIVPFALGGMGAGDVKLLAIIGAIKGPAFVLYTTIGMGLTGGVIGLVILAYEGKLWHTITSFLRGFWLMLITSFKVISFDFDHEKTMFPYGVAIVAGALGAMWWMR
ncbi:MAG: prepilin peptidase [Syntrophomonadaceae bacterium]|nr:prepilin peptidase [Syntrophomonadaceae bacterium]